LPRDDPVAILCRRLEILLRHGLPERAVDAIRSFAHQAAEDRTEHEDLPVYDWSILDDAVGLDGHIRAILADSPYSLIGDVDAASDDELLDLHRMGPSYLVELREAVARTIARHADVPDGD